MGESLDKLAQFLKSLVVASSVICVFILLVWISIKTDLEISYTLHPIELWSTRIATSLFMIIGGINLYALKDRPPRGSIDSASKVDCESEYLRGYNEGTAKAMANKPTPRAPIQIVSLPFPLPLFYKVGKHVGSLESMPGRIPFRVSGKSYAIQVARDRAHLDPPEPSLVKDIPSQVPIEENTRFNGKNIDEVPMPEEEKIQTPTDEIEKKEWWM